MLDDIFSFIDPIIELNEGDTECLVIPVEACFDFLEKNGIDKLMGLSENQEIPLSVALSLLKPDELEKLKNYIAAYTLKHGNG